MLELGSDTEAAALLAAIRSDPSSPADARAAVARAAARAGPEPRQAADTLVSLALAARKAGDGVPAQRLLDRAAASYERETVSALTLDAPPLGIYPARVAWSPNDQWLAVMDGRSKSAKSGCS